ncbi:MAG: hypothetical protein OEY01_03435 [Desulfobulbaceae bacterium]|nr:hypothetical protein [Desulfobulbaceae bacterium]
MSDNLSYAFINGQPRNYDFSSEAYDADQMGRGWSSPQPDFTGWDIEDLYNLISDNNIEGTFEEETGEAFPDTVAALEDLDID